MSDCLFWMCPDRCSKAPSRSQELQPCLRVSLFCMDKSKSQQFIPCVPVPKKGKTRSLNKLGAVLQHFSHLNDAGKKILVGFTPQGESTLCLYSSFFFNSLIICKLLCLAAWQSQTCSQDNEDTGNTSHMPQLTLQCAVTCCPVGLPFSWQLTWQDPLPLRNHHKDASRQVFMEPSPAASFFFCWFYLGFLIASCRTKRNPSTCHFHFIHSKFIQKQKKLTNI